MRQVQNVSLITSFIKKVATTALPVFYLMKEVDDKLPYIYKYKNARTRSVALRRRAITGDLEF